MTATITNEKQVALDAFRANGVSIAPANIPPCLTSPDFKQWMCWQARAEVNSDRKLKIKKPPYNPHNGFAGSKVKPAHWSNFADAIGAMERHGFDGVGIVLTADDDLVVLDLDNAVDARTGGPKDWAADIIGEMDSYSERSPSGTGFHIVCRGKVPDGTPTVFKHHDGKVEAFRAGSFVTITGVHPDGIDHGIDVEDRQQELDALLERLKPTRQDAPPAVQAVPAGEMPPLRDDMAKLVKSFKYKGKEAIGALFTEGPSAAGVDDHSDADLMLTGHLVWLLGKDPRRVDQLFRESACMRPKWDELRGSTTYGDRTINEAISTTKGVYSPRRKEGPRPSDPPNDDCIVVRPGEIARVADEIEALYLKPDLGMRFQVFQRDRQLVRVYVSPVHDLGRDQRKQKVAPAIAQLDKPYLASTSSRLGKFVKYDARRGEFTPCNPPMDAIDQLLANCGNWRVPALRSIVGSPTMRPDGTILNTEGYDAGTGCYLAEALPLTVPENPARGGAKAALHLLWNELFAGFCFVDELDRVVAFTALLTAVMRPMLKCAPLFIVTATTSGSGKSLLVDLISVLAIGKTAPAVAVAHDEKEFEKTLGAVLMEGVPFISMDNINGKLESNLLCQAVTQDTVKPRILGESVTRDIPNTAFMVANGNNISIAGDLARRTLLCRMDPGVERPELRKFDFNPLERAKENRARYISAVLTILRAYHCAGRPKMCDPLAGFEDWSQTARSALMWVQEGTPLDPVKSQETLVSEDGERAALRAFLTLWHKCLGNRPRTGGEVVLWAKDAPETDDAGAFVDALREIASDRRGEINPMTLAKFLKRNAGRVMEKHKLMKAGTYGAKPLWKVERMD